MRYLGRLALLVSITLLGGVAASQDADRSGAPTPAAPSEEGSGGSPGTSAPSSATRAEARDDDGAARPRARRSRHAKTDRASRRGRRVHTPERAAPSADSSATAGGDSVSVGRHNRGRLVHSAVLTESAHVRLKQPDGDHHYGTAEMVAMLRHAADYVWSRAPGVRLTVGDISRHHGGRFRPHRSHQSGRDVDVGFYIHDDGGLPVEPARFFDFRGDGSSRHDATWHFDDARNWALVEAFVTSAVAPVQYAFVSRALRTRLLDYGRAHGADPETLARAETVLWQPTRGGRHDDHFHVRIYCAPDDRPRCRDEAPHHAWTRGSTALAAAAERAAAAPEDREDDAERAARAEAEAEAELEARTSDAALGG